MGFLGRKTNTTIVFNINWQLQPITFCVHTYIKRDTWGNYRCNFDNQYQMYSSNLLRLRRLWVKGHFWKEKEI